MLRGLFLAVLEGLGLARGETLETHIPRHQASRSTLSGRQTDATPLFAFPPFAATKNAKRASSIARKAITFLRCWTD